MISRTLLICFLAGAASVAAFAPLGLYPLVLAAVAVLIHFWIGGSPASCARSGFAFGLGLFVAGVSWIYVSLHDIGGMLAPVAGLATLIALYASEYMSHDVGAGYCRFFAAFTLAVRLLRRTRGFTGMRETLGHQILRYLLGHPGARD